MSKFILVAVLLTASLGRVVALSAVGTAKEEVAVDLPYGPLIWGDVNFLHTTDSHGWLMGHQKNSAPEPNYSGDLGDFYSFVKHMKRMAEEKDVDLLLIDSGDLHDGTGLSDGYPPGGIDAHESNKFVKQLLTISSLLGNDVTLDVLRDFAPHWEGKYLTSNVNITIPNPIESNVTTSVSIGSRYRKFQTRQGRKVTAFGIMLDFTANIAGTFVQKVEDMVKEEWFQEAIKEEPDFFLFAGHMPVAHDNWPLVHDTIRKIHATTPIFIFGGHTHIRDCNQLDGRSMSIESGRYLESVGWMSAQLDNTHATQNLTITRRYLDTNRKTYEYHSGRHGQTFETEDGQQISAGMQELAARWNLTQSYGVAPQDYYLYWAPYPGNSSILTLLMNEVLPTVLKVGQPDRASIPSKIIVDNGVLRYDIYAGPFTKNDQLTASPYTDSFLYFTVPWSVGKQVYGKLSSKNLIAGLGPREVVHERRLSLPHSTQQVMIPNHAGRENLTLGYVTQDACPGVGDDTLHKALPYYNPPKYVASPDPDVTDSELVDLVVINFVAKSVAAILNSLQSQHNYTVGEAKPYSPYLMNDVFVLYAQTAWA